MKRLAALAAAAALTLTGCANDLDHGVVTGREHHGAWMQMLPMTTCSGNPSICTTSYTPVFWPESWVLHLRDGQRTGDHDVSSDEYERYREGDVYPRPEGDR